MLVADFLEMLLADTAEDSREIMLSGPDRLGWEGTLRGLDECRIAMLGFVDEDVHVMGERLSVLLREARQCGRMADGAPDEWFWMCREVAVEWISCVVSAIMVVKRLPPVLQPSQEAIRTVARIAGIV